LGEFEVTLLERELHSTGTDFALDRKPFCTVSSSDFGSPDWEYGPVAESLSVEWALGVSGVTVTLIVGPAATATAAKVSVTTAERARTLRIGNESMPDQDRASLGFMSQMPRSWIVMQALIVIFVLAGIVIALTRLL
jgi:hypothetical protein